MFLRFDAALNGKNFSDIAPEVLLRDIVELPAEMDTDATNRAGRYGQTVPTLARRSLSVRLVYRIREYDIQRRAAVNGMVAVWAHQGGWLTINTRPGVRLHVVCTSVPAMDSNLKWTQDLSITLTAYSVPYWEDEKQLTAFTVNTQWSDLHQMYFAANVFTPPGNLKEVPVTLRIFNINNDGAPLTHLKIVVGDTMMELKGMEAGAGSYMGAWIRINYTDDDILVIDDMRNDENPSLLQYRTAESSDDLLAACGQNNQVYIYSDVPVSASLFKRGRWL